MSGKNITEQKMEVGSQNVEVDTLPKILRRNRDKWGDSIAFRQKDLGVWQEWTWEEVYDEAKALCLGLMSLGLKRGETVGIIGENEPENFWAHYAIQAAGAKAVCLYPDVTPPEAHFLWDNSESVFIICEDQEQVDKALEVKDQLPRVKKVIYWDPRGMWKYTDPILMRFSEVQELGRSYEADHPGAFEESIAQGKAEDTAVLSYTSGTTGARPKGVIMTHGGLIDSADRVEKHVLVKPFLQYLSYIAPAWATEQMFGLTMGLRTPFVLNFPEEPETVLENLREIGTEALAFAPRQWEGLASTVQARLLDGNAFQQLMYKQAMVIGTQVAKGRLEGKSVNPVARTLYPLMYLLVLRPLRDKLGLLKTYSPICGGSAMAPDVFYFFQAMGVKLRNMYGMTEIGLMTVHMGEQYSLETVGRFMHVNPAYGPPIEWRVEETGELLVRGGWGFPGYYNNPEATAERMKGDWFQTGDALALREDGEMVYLERVGDMRQLSTGVRFPPQYIEIRLRFSPFVKDVISLGDETKPFVSALINIDSETVGRWAEKRGIAYSTFPDLSQKEKVLGLIKGEIDKVNRSLPAESRVLRFANLPKELDPDESELTRTRKLRRSFLEERFGGLIDSIYQGKAEFATEVPVKYRDGREGKVKTDVGITDTEAGMEVAR